MLERSRVARQTGGEPGRALRGGDASAVLTVGGRVGQVNTGKGSECRRSRKVFQIKGIRHTKTWWPAHLVGEEQRMLLGKVKRAGWRGRREQG